MIDPYARDTPGLAEPALNLVLIQPDDDNDLPIGIKALRIWNPNPTSATIHAITMVGDQVAFSIPAQSLWTEPLRIRRILTITSSGLTIHGYTDRALT